MATYLIVPYAEHWKLFSSYSVIPVVLKSLYNLPLDRVLHMGQDWVWFYNKKRKSILKGLFYFKWCSFALFIKERRKFNAQIVFHLQFREPGNREHLYLT